MSQREEILDSTQTVTGISEYQYPLQFKFKIGTLSNDFSATDAEGKMLAYVRQKLFKFKEAIDVYSDEQKENLIYRINADRIIDFNASYAFSDEEEQVFGHVGRKGMRSLFKAHYEIFDNDKKIEFTISEENPWAKFWDAMLSEVPLLGIFTGYLFNPRYIVKREDGTEVVRLSKEPSFWGRKFKIDKLSDVDKGEDERLMLSLMMMSLLERRRG